MKKYWILLRNQIGLITTYRVELFGRWTMTLFEVIVYYSLWRLTSQGDPERTKQIFSYFVLAYGIFQNAQTSKVARWMAMDILSGDAVTYFVKPITFPFVIIFKSITSILSRVISPALITFLGVIFFPNYLAPHSLINFVLAFITALLGLIFWNQLMIIIGTFSFWGTEIESLVISVSLALNLAKGAYIPAFLFPDQIKKILNLTPINYLVALPIDIYQNPIDPRFILNKFLIILGWLIVFGLLTTWLYKKGLKHYQAFGG